ncbi:hypothetical protein GCM10025864_26130 [Luteimicrobium album]|uniref:Uncharacterized protein n=1 Tax=Luteimicrobium album TaxID=1054550 RepID=A0ABQ6I4E7_9MICO|nr:hypothetical protein GCM10025864_26130 [Luteimicrobium album]
MGREEHRHAGGGALAEHAAHDVDGDRVETRERLVEHEDLRVVGERRGELDALLVAQRQLLHLVRAAVRDAQDLRPALHRVPGLGRRLAVQAGQVDELLVDAHARVQAALLRHVADPAPHLEVDGLPVPPHLTRVGSEDAQGDPHGRRLAGAVGTDEPEDLPRRDVERHVAQGADRAVRLVEVVDLEGGHRAPGSVGCP